MQWINCFQHYINYVFGFQVCPVVKKYSQYAHIHTAKLKIVYQIFIYFNLTKQSTKYFYREICKNVKISSKRAHEILK